MTTIHDYSHCVTALVAVSAKRAFDFLSDPIALGQWSLGCMRTQRTETPDVYSGRSLFNGQQNWFAIEANRGLLLVDFRTGVPDRLVWRISARVMPAENCGLPANHCYVTLTAWRTVDMTDARWRQLCAAHEAEILLIKAQMEGAEPAGRDGQAS